MSTATATPKDRIQSKSRADLLEEHAKARAQVRTDLRNLSRRRPQSSFWQELKGSLGLTRPPK